MLTVKENSIGDDSDLSSDSDDFVLRLSSSDDEFDDKDDIYHGSAMHCIYKSASEELDFSKFSSSPNVTINSQWFDPKLNMKAIVKLHVDKRLDSSMKRKKKKERTKRKLTHQKSIRDYFSIINNTDLVNVSTDAIDNDVMVNLRDFVYKLLNAKVVLKKIKTKDWANKVFSPLNRIETDKLPSTPMSCKSDVKSGLKKSPSSPIKSGVKITVGRTIFPSINIDNKTEIKPEKVPLPIGSHENDSRLNLDKVSLSPVSRESVLQKPTASVIKSENANVETVDKERLSPPVGRENKVKIKLERSPSASINANDNSIDLPAKKSIKRPSRYENKAKVLRKNLSLKKKLSPSLIIDDDNSKKTVRKKPLLPSVDSQNSVAEKVRSAPSNHESKAKVVLQKLPLPLVGDKSDAKIREQSSTASPFDKQADPVVAPDKLAVPLIGRENGLRKALKQIPLEFVNDDSDKKVPPVNCENDLKVVLEKISLPVIDSKSNVKIAAEKLHSVLSNNEGKAKVVLKKLPGSLVSKKIVEKSPASHFSVEKASSPASVNRKIVPRVALSRLPASLVKTYKNKVSQPLETVCSSPVDIDDKINASVKKNKSSTLSTDCKSDEKIEIKKPAAPSVCDESQEDQMEGSVASPNDSQEGQVDEMEASFASANDSTNDEIVEMEEFPAPVIAGKGGQEVEMDVSLASTNRSTNKDEIETDALPLPAIGFDDSKEVGTENLPLSSIENKNEKVGWKNSSTTLVYHENETEEMEMKISVPPVWDENEEGELLKFFAPSVCGENEEAEVEKSPSSKNPSDKEAKIVVKKHSSLLVDQYKRRALVKETKEMIYQRKSPFYIRYCWKCQEESKLKIKPKISSKCDICRENLIYKCISCGKPYNKYKSIYKHVQTHFLSFNKYHCIKCSLAFIRKNSVFSHYKIAHAKDETSDADIPFYVSTKISKDEVLFTCYKCNHESRHNTELKRHIKIKHLTDIKCHKCGKVFETDFHRLFHITNCKEPSTLSCESCPFKSSNRDIMAKHCQIHMNQLKKAFAKEVQIKAGPSKHSDFNSRATTRAICPKCLKERAISTAVKQSHCHKCRSPLRYNCSMCSMEFSTFESARKHVLRHTDCFFGHECKKCGKRFSQFNHMSMHRKICASVTVY